MNDNELFEYLKLIKPALEEYAKKNNTTIEEILKNLIKDNPQNYKLIRLEDTGLFNYKGGQSTIYNRLHKNNIATLDELFKAHNNNSIDYGKKEDKQNKNYYLHQELDGIISLLKYKYLSIIPDKLKELLNYNINTNYNITIDKYHLKYNRPGDVLYSIPNSIFITEEDINSIYEFYMILKSCGFNQVGTKALIDIAYQENINNISLGEFLFNLSPDIIYKRFAKTPQELTPFMNILNIIKDFYSKYYKTKTPHKSI